MKKGAVGTIIKTCASCKRYVKVKVYLSGDHYVAECLFCKEILYDSSEPPQDMEKIE